MRSTIRFTVAVLFVSVLVNVAMSADTEKKEKGSCIFHMYSMKDVKYEVTNTPDGVTIKISSDKPEVIKQIQESTAQCHEAHKSGDHKGMCPMKTDSKCPGHGGHHADSVHQEGK
jgi:hypothetical protein